jgi:hypothetical protein
VTAEHFQVRTTRDLVELCGVGESDPLRVAALHFCQGFLVGTVQYHQAAMAAPGHVPVVCLPSPPPSRDAAVREFVAWARQNPGAPDERPADGSSGSSRAAGHVARSPGGSLDMRVVIGFAVAVLAATGCVGMSSGERSVFGGGAMGAAGGAAGGAIAGDAGLGAAIGAMVGMVGGAVAHQHAQQGSAAHPTGAATAPPAGAATPLQIGTLVPALPAGCTPLMVQQVQHFNCQGVFYRPTNVGTKVFYEVVAQPPA